MELSKLLLPVMGDWQITQSFREHLAFAATHVGMKYNAGVDFYSNNRNIYACDSGTVVQVGFDSDGYGFFIKLQHSWGFSLYAHLEQNAKLQVRDEVKSSEPIGIMGSTGFSTGVHLHFETRDQDGKIFDPTGYLIYGAEPNGQEVINSGDEIEVVAPLGANFRKRPSFDCADVLGRLEPGQNLRVTGSAIQFGTLEWLPVEITMKGYVAKVDGEGTRLVQKKSA